MIPFQMDNAKITAAVARVTKFHDRYVGETDEDLKLNYLEGLVKAAKALMDLGQQTMNAVNPPGTANTSANLPYGHPSHLIGGTNPPKPQEGPWISSDTSNPGTFDVFGRPSKLSSDINPGGKFPGTSNVSSGSFFGGFPAKPSESTRITDFADRS